MTCMAIDLEVPARLVAAIVFIVASAIAVGVETLAVPGWKAAHGGGVVGTYTLKEALGCDRYEPPRQRCGWFGDFLSDDGTVERRDMEFSGGLPKGAKVGDTRRARYTGSRTVIYPESGPVTWKPYALTLVIASLVAIVSFVLVEPWLWIAWAIRRWKRRAS
jgi:hypothetical protein